MFSLISIFEDDFLVDTEPPVLAEVVAVTLGVGLAFVVLVTMAIWCCSSLLPKHSKKQTHAQLERAESQTTITYM